MRAHAVLFAALAGAVLAAVGGPAWADAPWPSDTPLVYTGVVTDQSHLPADGVAIEVGLFSAGTGGFPLCSGSGTSEVDGTFAVLLSSGAACATATDGLETWVQVTVAGTALARTRVGAVPNALEAGRFPGSERVLDSSSAGERVERATMADECLTGTCDLASASEGILDVEYVGGWYVATFVPGTFSSAPTCVASLVNTAGFVRVHPTAEKVELLAVNPQQSSGMPGRLSFVCVGPR